MDSGADDNKLMASSEVASLKRMKYELCFGLSR
jgi:hypothetical protein